jgi:tetraprenyl-beta-curcumene synthase
VGGALGPTRTARAGGALLLANARYWSNVAPLARSQLARWERDARAIPDPLLAAVACGKLRAERFNVELAATLATLAPRGPRRVRAVAAIVALQVAYDYLDALTEQPTAAQLSAQTLSADPSDDARRLHRALLDAVAPADESHEDYYEGLRHSQDGGYLRELAQTVRSALGGLPGAGAIADVARRAAERCAEAQVLAHAAARTGDTELERWARSEAAGYTLSGGRTAPAGNPLERGRTVLRWPEFLAGAQASVLALHALIAAAADERTSTRDAERIDALYLSIGALSMLDSLIDSEQDAVAGERGYARHYDSPEQLADRLGELARDAMRQTRGLPHGGHHAITLAGVVAFYASAPAASDPLARPAITRVRRELQPLIAPTLLVMRVWRASKLLRRPGRVVSSR